MKLIVSILFVIMLFLVGCGNDTVVTPAPPAPPVVKPNQVPVVSALNVDPPRITLGNHGITHCVTSDADDFYADLNFYWSATGGQMNNLGGEYNIYTPFFEGGFVIKCTVCDPHGGCGMKEQPVEVTTSGGYGFTTAQLRERGLLR